MQGEPSGELVYLQSGKIKITVIQSWGKEAVVAIPWAWRLFRRGLLAGPAKADGHKHRHG